MATRQEPFSTTENYTSLTYSWNITSSAGTGTSGTGTAGIISAGVSEIVGSIPKGISIPSLHGNRTLEQNTILQTTIKDIQYNGTGYYLEDDGDAGLNDVQTLFLACFATLIFLAVIVFAALGVRMLWRNYQRTKESTKYDGILHREGTSESISRPLHSHLLETDKNLTETHLILTTEQVQICDGMEINSQTRNNNHSSTNGSIITMTMKNNHLIVETEERNDLEEDSRETTLKYSPGASDGVFVVEVQQGVRRSPGSAGHTTHTEPVSISVSDQCALVHNPPDRYSDEDTVGEYDDSEYYIDTISPSRDTPDSLLSRLKTGLTQSNASISKPSYCYSNQQCYDMGSYGYTYGYTEQSQPLPIPLKTTEDTLPKITAAIYKNTLKRSPSTEDLHVAAMSTNEDEIVNDVSKDSSDGEIHKEVQNSTLDEASKSPGTNETEVRSTLAVDENADSRCNELPTS